MRPPSGLRSARAEAESEHPPPRVVPEYQNGQWYSFRDRLSIPGPGGPRPRAKRDRQWGFPTAAGYSAGRFMMTAIAGGTARVFPADHLRRYLAEHAAALWPVAAGLCERLADAEERIASAARDNADCRSPGSCAIWNATAYRLQLGARHSVRSGSARPSSPHGSARAGKPSTGPSCAGADAGSSPPGTAPSSCTTSRPSPV